VQHIPTCAHKMDCYMTATRYSNDLKW